MKTTLTRALAIAILSANIAGSAMAEKTKSCNDQQSSTQAKVDKHAKKAKDSKPKYQAPDNSFYAIFG